MARNPEEFVTARLGKCVLDADTQWCNQHNCYWPRQAGFCNEFVYVLDIVECFDDEKNKQETL